MKKHSKSIPNRGVRVADQIQRDLSALISREVRDPRVKLVTIMEVEVTPDYSHAKIYVSTLSDKPEEMLVGLQQAAPMLRNLLFKKITIHTVPTLHFLLDKSVEKSTDLMRVIAEANALPPAKD